MVNEMQAQAGFETTLFKTKLTGVLDSSSGATVIKQNNSGLDAPSITLTEFKDDIGIFFKKVTGVDVPAFPAVLDSLGDTINVAVRQIYMLMKPKGTDVSVAGKYDLEFAFAVAVSSDAVAALGLDKLPVTVDEVNMKIWNTDKGVILDDMNIFDMTKIL